MFYQEKLLFSKIQNKITKEKKLPRLSREKATSLHTTQRAHQAASAVHTLHIPQLLQHIPHHTPHILWHQSPLICISKIPAHIPTGDCLTPCQNTKVPIQNAHPWSCWFWHRPLLPLTFQPQHHGLFCHPEAHKGKYSLRPCAVRSLLRLWMCRLHLLPSTKTATPIWEHFPRIITPLSAWHWTMQCLFPLITDWES